MAADTSSDGGATNTHVYHKDPTWESPIKSFFDKKDLECMNKMSINLGNYDDVRKYAPLIFHRLTLKKERKKNKGEDRMPLGHPPWTDQSIQTFLIWIQNGCKKDKHDVPNYDGLFEDGGATNECLIENPGWADISKFFSEKIDVPCMQGRLNLSDYKDVKKWSSKIYQHVNSPDPATRMPLGCKPWSKNSIQTFDNWIANGCPEDGSKPNPSKAATNKVVNEDPSWMEDIKDYFLEEDVLCMSQARDYDFREYGNVVRNAPNIYQVVEEGVMPPPDAGSNRKWSTESVKTFANWMKNGYKYDKHTPPPVDLPLNLPEKEPRLRKSLDEVSCEELLKLRAAMTEIQNRDTKKVDRHDISTYSYEFIAGLHYHWCMHHVENFLPWHRAYIQVMENALRAVGKITFEGQEVDCSDVYVPYWDNLNKKPPPEWMYEAPFAHYTLQYDIGNPASEDFHFKAGTTTKRHKRDHLVKSWLEQADAIWGDVEIAMKKDNWEEFNGLGDRSFDGNGEMHSHDYGHNQTGNTMANSLLSSFDPIFFVFHCNHDRLWHFWQKKHNATTLRDFQDHCADGHTAPWLNKHPINLITPWNLQADETINLKDVFNVEYTAAESDKIFEKEVKSFAEVKLAPGDARIILPEDPRVAVRYANFNRLEVPHGTFTATLWAKEGQGKQILGSRAVFQNPQPKTCPSCVQRPYVNFEFLLTASKIAGKELILEIKSSVKPDVKFENGIGHPEFSISYIVNLPGAFKKKLDDETPRDRLAKTKKHGEGSGSPGSCVSKKSGCPFAGKK